MASTPFAFILWWFGGIFGLHHLYLGRDLHAYLTWTVAPLSLLVVPWMVFWFRDFVRLSDYVEDANGGPGSCATSAVHTGCCEQFWCVRLHGAPQSPPATRNATHIRVAADGPDVLWQLFRVGGSCGEPFPASNSASTRLGYRD